MHLICPPKFCITFVFHFSWILPAAAPRQIENNPYAQFWGANMVHYGKRGSGVRVREKGFMLLECCLKWEY